MSYTFYERDKDGRIRIKFRRISLFYIVQSNSNQSLIVVCFLEKIVRYQNNKMEPNQLSMAI